MHLQLMFIEDNTFTLQTTILSRIYISFTIDQSYEWQNGIKSQRKMPSLSTSFPVKNEINLHINSTLDDQKFFKGIMAFGEFALKTFTVPKGSSPCAQVASVMEMRDLKIDIQQ
ncbi:hypothetical protein BD560DRAFT_427187 [Blakeslea trispora]|nr:hypothetical protein BD560DRAFT_427187 [Blakeslea trispora]